MSLFIKAYNPYPAIKKPASRKIHSPLSEGFPLWEQYVKRLQKSNVPRAMILEFVEGDSPEAFLRDAATLHRLLGSTVAANYAEEIQNQ